MSVFLGLGAIFCFGTSLKLAESSQPGRAWFPLLVGLACIGVML